MNILKNAVLAYFIQNKKAKNEDETSILTSFIEGDSHFISGHIDNNTDNLYCEFMARIENGQIKISNVTVIFSNTILDTMDDIVIQTNEPLYLRGNIMQRKVDSGKEHIFTDVLPVANLHAKQRNIYIINSQDEQIMLVDKRGRIQTDLRGINVSYYLHYNESISDFDVYIKISDFILDYFEIDYIVLDNQIRARLSYVTYDALKQFIGLEPEDVSLLLV